MASPSISVVVATYNRVHLLPRLLDALVRQEGAPAYEVIIVDNGSTDGTAAELPRLVAELDLDIRVLRLDPNRGPAPARNAGWRAAQAAWVAFTDDDCIPQSGWLRGLAAATDDRDIVLGRTLGNPTQPREGFFAWSPETTADRGFFETCNIAYRRDVLERLGGFEESIHEGVASTGRPERAKPAKPATWGDDTEFGLRAKAAGATSVFAEDAVVWHDVKPGGFRDRLADIPRRAGLVAAAKRQPAMRELHESHWFLQNAHAWALIAVAGASVIAVRPRHPSAWLVAGALATPWARRRGAGYPKRVWPLLLPQWFVVDLFEISVLAVASAKERTLLL